MPEKYEQGREAAFDGLPVSANPYTAGGRDAEQWYEGWSDAVCELADNEEGAADTPTVV